MAEFVLIDTERGVPREHRVAAVEGDEGVWLDAADVARLLGWKVESEGLCRGDVCIPVRDRAALVRGQRVRLSELASALGRPLALDADGGVAVLGAAPADRAAALRGAEAPDFTLPDWQGRSHTLSHHRGSKVLFVAYASW